MNYVWRVALSVHDIGSWNVPFTGTPTFRDDLVEALTKQDYEADGSALIRGDVTIRCERSNIGYHTPVEVTAVLAELVLLEEDLRQTNDTLKPEEA